MSKRNLELKFALLPGVVVLGLIAFALTSCTAKAQSSNMNATTGRADATAEQSTNKLPSDAMSDEALKRRLTDVFTFCRNNRADLAAEYFVYRGPDKTREWRDNMRAGDLAENSASEEICRRIKGYLDNSTEQVLGAVKVEQESEGEWHVIEVTFRKGDKTEKALFAFLPINGQFAIGDID